MCLQVKQLFGLCYQVSVRDPSSIQAVCVCQPHSKYIWESKGLGRVLHLTPHGHITQFTKDTPPPKVSQCPRTMISGWVALLGKERFNRHYPHHICCIFYSSPATRCLYVLPAWNLLLNSQRLYTKLGQVFVFPLPCYDSHCWSPPPPAVLELCFQAHFEGISRWPSVCEPSEKPAPGKCYVQLHAPFALCPLYLLHLCTAAFYGYVNCDAYLSEYTPHLTCGCFLGGYPSEYVDVPTSHPVSAALSSSLNFNQVCACASDLFVFGHCSGDDHTIPCHIIPHHTMPYHTVLCRAYRTVPHHTIPYHTTPYHTIPYRTARHRTAPYHTIPYHTIPFSGVPPGESEVLPRRGPRAQGTPPGFIGQAGRSSHRRPPPAWVGAHNNRQPPPSAPPKRDSGAEGWGYSPMPRGHESTWPYTG